MSFDSPMILKTRWRLLAACGLFITGCTPPSSSLDEQMIVMNQCEVELRHDSPIEEYILALPAFAFHEESVESFADRVRSARKTDPANKAASRDSLHVGSDGTWPAKDFVLDRDKQLLRIRVNGLLPGEESYETTMRKVPGGWMKRAESEVTSGETR